MTADSPGERPERDGPAASPSRFEDLPPTLPLVLRLPATSANLGPGFDAVGLAMSLFLTVRAEIAPAFSLHAAGRNAALVGSLSGNLMLETYASIVASQGCELKPLALSVENEIPLGMGCGSSAAALCAGVMLASHFCGLGWSLEQILDVAADREGHPDNVAACLLGGLTVSKAISQTGSQTIPRTVTGLSAKISPNDPGELSHRSYADASPRQTITATFGRRLPWRLLLALPSSSLATSVARALLPAVYSRADTVSNIQSTALLVSAFAQNRPDLLVSATQDRLHQPYRAEACPLLPALLPLAGRPGVHSVTLSGAGPAVLLIADDQFEAKTVQHYALAVYPQVVEVLDLKIASGATWDTGNAV